LFLGGTGSINRLLKKAQLLRWPHPFSFRRRSNYASFQGISAALYLDLFEQPVKFEFFIKLLGSSRLKDLRKNPPAF
jgi:hypothetical protein